MQIKSPTPQPKRTTVELTREEVEEALRDYIVKHSTTCIPTGKITMLSMDHSLDNVRRFKIADKVFFVIEEPVE